MTLRDYQLKYALNEWVENPSPHETIIYDLIHSSANDGNSSLFREDITNLVSGREPSKSKHGYDCDTEPIEIKPRNFTGKQKLSGGGNFGDFTWKRHAKYQNDGVIVSTSGFYYGKLIFVVELPYKTLITRINTQLKKLLPNGDEVNRYARSCSFSYLDWKDTDFNLVWISPNFEDYKESMVSGLYKTLKNLKQKQND
jgi:hypothetical protein